MIKATHLLVKELEVRAALISDFFLRFALLSRLSGGLCLLSLPRSILVCPIIVGTVVVASGIVLVIIFQSLLPVYTFVSAPISCTLIENAATYSERHWEAS